MGMMIIMVSAENLVSFFFSMKPDKKNLSVDADAGVPNDVIRCPFHFSFSTHS